MDRMLLCCGVEVGRCCLLLCRAKRPVERVTSLQRLCERELARSLVEPRTVLQVLDFADAAGSKMLRAHCLGVRRALICPSSKS